jgi:hypothetical protein
MNIVVVAIVAFQPQEMILLPLKQKSNMGPIRLIPI